MNKLPSARPIVNIAATADGKLAAMTGEFARWLDQIRLRVDSFATIPAGMMQATLSSVEPEDWLMCNGQTVSKRTYAELYDVMGGAYGETVTDFDLPNLTNSSLVGAGAVPIMGLLGAANIPIDPANIKAIGVNWLIKT